jgi:glyoxylase-like metal-dependent hydrolase (beta-lactamase superfamily II)
MKIHSLNTGYFKLDGGAMFGVVPKSIWQKTNPADANNLCTWAMRSLLIEEGKRLVLIDTGIGNKQDENFLKHYYLHGEDSLEGNLKKLGYSKDDITDVFLTHLHFDHCGGSVEWGNKERTFLQPSFKNATFWSTENHWQWATNPNPREKASFLKENIMPIDESGQLKFITRNQQLTKADLKDFYLDIFFADGHTESQMIPILNYKGRKIAFMADLLPSTGHIPLPYVMGYDTRPLMTMDEKKTFLNYCVENDVVVFLEHDPINECCTLQNTEKGVRLKEAFNLSELG